MMIFRQKINTYFIVLRRVPIMYYFVVGVLLVMTLYLVIFREKTLLYSYGGKTCDQRLVLLPDIFAQVGNERYEIHTQGGWSVAGHRLTATSLCVAPLQAPLENSSETVAYAPWGGWFARLTYVVDAASHPEIDADVLKAPIPVSRSLKLPLSEPDATFSYKLEAGDNQVVCESKERELLCDVPVLGLIQGSEYEVVLEKYFKSDKVDEALSAHVETLSPLSVLSTSIEREATVYDKPATVVIATDKAIGRADFSVRRIDGETTEVKASTEFKDKELVVTFAEELPRQATIEVAAKDLEAIDGSTPLDAYSLAFKTSGGPRVTGVNVGGSGVPLGSQIIVTFDQELAADQDIAPLVTVSGGVTLQARRGNQLVFSTNDASRCAPVAIALKAEIASPYGVAGQSSWRYDGRMQCYTVTTIGHSSQGRPIQAYHFGGSGPSTLYTGAIHGNEASTKHLMDRWIQELDANPGKLPPGKRVVIVPAINPDGVARNSRLNARGVDLNRNFGVSDWQKDIQHTNGSAFPGGGGSEPMSEPETRAIAAFAAQLRPELVISYHSIGGMVISNQKGQASARASRYAGLSGYRISAGGSGDFGYQITGTADDYYNQVLGVPSILIELGSHSYHQFERNQAAMWAMLH